MNLNKTAITGLLLLVSAFLLPSCGAVPLTAPGGATFTVTANPTSIPAAGGTSQITIVMFKSAEDGGGTVADGTFIFLTTNLGVIEERVSTSAGVAVGTLQSTGRAGTATVTASSGTVTAEPVTVEVGAGINILLTANPPTVSSPDFSTELVATVFDNENNRVADVPVIFSTSAGALASQGTILRTNSSGQASDRLTLLNENSATVTVFAGQVASNAVSVNRGTLPGPVVSSISPTSGAPGQTLDVTIDGLNFLPGAVVSFGEGISVTSVSFVDSNRLIATIFIDSNVQNTGTTRTVTVTNPDGTSDQLTSAFRITTASPAPVITSLSPTQTALRDPTIQTVFITGFNFQAGAQVTFTPSAGVTIDALLFNSSTQLEVDIIVDTVVSGGPAAGTVLTVEVTNPDLLQSNGQSFTVN